MGFIRFLGFTLARAGQGFWRNGMMSLAATATVVLMLVLLAGLLIVLGGLDSGLTYIESKVGVTARLVDDVSSQRIDQITAEMEAVAGVAEVEYVSPEEALARLEQAYRERGQELDTGGAEITLYASLEVALSDPEAGDEVVAALALYPEVERITTRQDQYDKLLGVIGLIRTIGLVAIVLVGLVVIFMVVNTIRIAVYSRAGEVEIMRLVGASDPFIRWPFIVEGILCGLIGAVVTVGLVALAWGPIQPLLVSVFQMPTAVSDQFLTGLAVLLVSVGLIIGALGSWISVRSNLSSAA
jgi:cell division transport system permease protein